MATPQPVKLDVTPHERVWGVSMPGDRIIGEWWYTAEPPLPILVKFIQTSDKLSVQVHPQGECGAGKTEMWHILGAQPGARIALGFNQPIGAEALRAAALTPEIEDLLRWIPVHPGETYFIPAGTIHAIGAGISLCEIQQNSDITYRLYDYGRPRPLHLDSALEAADLGAWSHPGAAVPRDLDDGWERLAECPYFATDIREVNGHFGYVADRSTFELLIVLEGSGQLNGERFGDRQVGWLLPAGAAVELAADKPLRLLRTYVPSADD